MLRKKRSGALGLLAEYYSVQRSVSGKPGPAALAEKGGRRFAEGAPSRDIQACAACHGDKGQGKGASPRIAGQHAEYIVRQLNELRTKSGKRFWSKRRATWGAGVA